jgi:hypothetical protein
MTEKEEQKQTPVELYFRYALVNKSYLLLFFRVHPFSSPFFQKKSTENLNELFLIFNTSLTPFESDLCIT